MQQQALMAQNELLSRSIAPMLVQYQMINEWYGQMPTVSGGAPPLIQLPKP